MNRKLTLEALTRRELLAADILTPSGPTPLQGEAERLILILDQIDVDPIVVMDGMAAGEPVFRYDGTTDVTTHADAAMGVEGLVEVVVGDVAGRAENRWDGERERIFAQFVGAQVFGSAEAAVQQQPQPLQSPTITPIDDISVEVGQTATVAFTVGDRDTALSELTVKAESSNQATVDDDSLVLSGGPQDYTLALQAIGAGEADITVRVGDGIHITDEVFRVGVFTPVPDPEPGELPPAVIEMPWGEIVPNFAHPDNVGGPLVEVTADANWSTLGIVADDTVLIHPGVTLTLDVADAEAEAVGAAGRFLLPDGTGLIVDELQVFDGGDIDADAATISIRDSEFESYDPKEHGIGIIAVGGNLHFDGTTVQANGVGHIIAMNRADLRILNSEIYHSGRTTTDPLGPNNQIGRYGVHLHHLYGVDRVQPWQWEVRNTLIEGDGIAKSAVTIHDAHHGTIDSSTVRNYMGVGIVTETGNETGVVVSNNVVENIPGDPRAQRERMDDDSSGETSAWSKGTAYFQTGVGVEWVGNIGRDAHDGYAFYGHNRTKLMRFPLYPGASTADDGIEGIDYRTGFLAGETPVTMRDNVAENIDSKAWSGWGTPPQFLTGIPIDGFTVRNDNPTEHQVAFFLDYSGINAQNVDIDGVNWVILGHNPNYGNVRLNGATVTNARYLYEEDSQVGGEIYVRNLVADLDGPAFRIYGPANPSPARRFAIERLQLVQDHALMELIGDEITRPIDFRIWENGYDDDGLQLWFDSDPDAPVEATPHPKYGFLSLPVGPRSALKTSPFEAGDVNEDGKVSAADALVIINQLNRG